MPFWDYEPDNLRIERNVSGAQYQLQQGFEAVKSAPGNLLGSVAGGIGEGLGVLGRATEPTRSVIGHVLELSQRPGAAVRGAYGYGLSGQNPLEGAGRGLLGGAPVPGPLQTPLGMGPTVPGLPEQLSSGAGFLESKGVGTAPVGPFDTRGIAGFGLDVATDPLTYIPFGRLAGAARGGLAGIRGASEVVPRLAETALPRITGTTVGERAAQLMDPGRVAQFTAKASQLPGLGWGIKRAADLVSDNILAFTDPTGKRALLNSFNWKVDQLNGQARAAVSTLRARPLASKFNELGQMQLRDADGNLFWHAAGDVFENPDKFAGQLLNPADAATIKQGHAIYDSYRSEWQKTWDELHAVAPDVADHFEMGKPVELAEGAHFWPRYALHDDGMPHPEPRNTPVGAVGKTMREERQVSEQEQAIAGGAKYLDPLQAMQQRIYDLSGDMAQMQLATRLQETKVASTIESNSLRNLREMQKTAKDALDADPKNADFRKSYEIAKASYTQAHEGALSAVEGLKQASTPYLKGLWFQQDDARDISARLMAHGLPGLDFVGNWGSISRTLQTSFDFGGPLIQGLVALVNKPDLFMRSYVRSLHAFADEGVSQRFLASDRTQDVLRRTGGALSVGGAEETETTATRLAHSAAEAGTGTDTMLNPERAARFAQRLPGLARFQRSFDTFGDALRVEWAASLLPTAEKGGQKAVQEMVDFINHATGVTSTRGMGIKPTQRAVESILLFAPRYTRSAAALVGDILSGGMAAQEATKSIAGLMSVGVMEYARVAQVLGQKPELDPNKPGFLTVNIAGERVGPGGVWVSLARALAKLNDPQNAGRATDISDPSNPLVRFFRARTGPTAGTVWDTMMHESYMGEPLYTAGDYVKYFGTKWLPMSLGGVLVDQGSAGRPMAPGQTAANFAGTFGGLRTFPQGFTEIRDEEAKSRFGKPFAELDPFQQVEVGESPRVKELPLPQGQQFQAMRERQGAFEQYRGDVNKLGAEVAAGNLTKSQFRKLVNEQSATLQIRLGDVQDTGRPRPITDPLEQERNRYYELLKSRDIEGKPDFDTAEAYLASLSPASRQNVKDRQLASYGRLDPTTRQLMEELWQARQTTKPYWELKDKALARFRLDDEWDKASPAERERLADTPRFKQAARVEKRDKDALRSRNRAIDTALATWWGETPIAERGGTAKATIGGALSANLGGGSAGGIARIGGGTGGQARIGGGL